MNAITKDMGARRFHGVIDDQLFALEAKLKADEEDIRQQIIAHATGAVVRSGVWRVKVDSALRHITKERKAVEAEWKTRALELKEFRYQAEMQQQERNLLSRQQMDAQSRRNLYFFRAAKKLLPRDLQKQIWARAKQFQPGDVCWDGDPAELNS